MPLEDLKITISKETILKILIAGNMVLIGLLSYFLFANPATGDAPQKYSVLCGNANQVVIAQNGQGAGVWVRKPGMKQYAYIYSGPNHSPYIALGDSSGIDPLAFYLGDDGKPYVQLKKGTSYEVFAFEDLLKGSSPKPIGKDVGAVSRGALPPD